MTAAWGMSPADWKRLLATGRPHVFALHNAAWRAGYQVNGVPA